MYKLRLNPYKSITYKKIDYANFGNGINTSYDEYSTPITYSKNTYNFNFKNGALKTGIGIGPLEVDVERDGGRYFKTLVTPDGLDVIAVWSFDRYVEQLDSFETYIIIYCSDKKLYYASLIDGTTFFSTIDSTLTFESVPTAIKYKLDGYDCMIFSTPEDGMYVFTGTSYYKQTSDCPPITSMCLHYERLFATVNGEKISLWFSDDLDPTNWNISSVEAGFINMIDARGPLNKVVNFKDYVFVFREYGISKLTAYGDQAEFNVTHLFLGSTKIYEKTVCVCGDVILMLLKDGIYAFDGINTQKLTLNIENIINPTKNAVACYHNGKYYLACNITFPDDEVVGCESENFTNNALIELDYLNGTFNITRGIDITYIYSSQDVSFSKLFCCYKNDGASVLGFIDESGGVLDSPTIKFWRSPKNDFGYPNKDKILKEIYFNAKQETEVIVESEKEIKSFVVNPVNYLIKINANMIGKEFAIHFRVTTKEAYISNPQIVVGFY